MPVNATNISYNNLNGNLFVQKYRKGPVAVSGKATLPMFESEAFIPNVGLLTDKSLVWIRQAINNGGSTALKVIELYAGRTYGNNGTLWVRTVNDNTVTVDTTFFFKILNP